MGNSFPTPTGPAPTGPAPTRRPTPPRTPRPTPAPTPCGGVGERACCVAGNCDIPPDTNNGIPRSCGPGFTEVVGGGCSGDCRCGADAAGNVVEAGICRAFSSLGTCRTIPPCGEEGQRACCVTERDLTGTGGPCGAGLYEESAVGILGNNLCIDELGFDNCICKDLGGIPSIGICRAIPNEPPVCNAGGPYMVECQGSSTMVQLDGSSSSDPDMGPAALTYQWTTTCADGTFDDATIASPKLNTTTHGSCSVSLTVSDGEDTHPCESGVEVVDTTDPVVKCPSSPTELSVSGDCTAAMPDLTEVADVDDVCDDSPTIMQVPAAGTSLGPESYSVTFVAMDKTGHKATVTCPNLVTVVDDKVPTPEDIDCGDLGSITKCDVPQSVTFASEAVKKTNGCPLQVTSSFEDCVTCSKGKRKSKVKGSSSGKGGKKGSSYGDMDDMGWDDNTDYEYSHSMDYEDDYLREYDDYGKYDEDDEDYSMGTVEGSGKGKGGKKGCVVTYTGKNMWDIEDEYKAGTHIEFELTAKDAEGREASKVCTICVEKPAEKCNQKSKLRSRRELKKGKFQCSDGFPEESFTCLPKGKGKGSRKG